MGDEDAWQEFVNRFGPDGRGQEPEPAPKATPKLRPQTVEPQKRRMTADDTDAWNDFLTDFTTPTVAEELPAEPTRPPPPKPERRDRTDYDRRVDLHGLSRRAAAELLDRRLLEARLMGLENLLVITGRGLHSHAGPVLQLWLPEWAQRHADGAPLRCEPADPAIGGSGAFLVWV